ncbi:MAG: dockerin type I domain-containing protein, partial [Candidatus Zixiibacteriota bacterium]
CFFGINIWNNPPVLSVQDSIFALADHISGFPVSATDADNDSVTTSMNAFWFAEDSLQPPVNSPAYNNGNPGSFSWVPTTTDTGNWVASFSATDVCGKADTARVSVLVGVTSCGDCTNDSLIDVGDVVFLINYLFKGGTAPDPICRGDVNCSGLADIGDVILLINYLYKGGTAPCFGCCG